MTEKELVRRALLGDKQAQKECTSKGIVLPCPFCRGESRLEDMGWPHHVYCTKCGARLTSTKWGEDGEKESIKKWNARPAPPIGRCRECKHLVLCNHYNPFGNAISVAFARSAMIRFAVILNRGRNRRDTETIYKNADGAQNPKEPSRRNDPRR